MSATSPESILGVKKGVGFSEIRQAYLGLAKILHPDKSNDPKSAEKFRRVHHAYLSLKQSAARNDSASAHGACAAEMARQEQERKNKTISAMHAAMSKVERQQQSENQAFYKATMQMSKRCSRCYVEAGFAQLGSYSKSDGKWYCTKCLNKSGKAKQSAAKVKNKAEKKAARAKQEAKYQAAKAKKRSIRAARAEKAKQSAAKAQHTAVYQAARAKKNAEKKEKHQRLLIESNCRRKAECVLPTGFEEDYEYGWEDGHGSDWFGYGSEEYEHGYDAWPQREIDENSTGSSARCKRRRAANISGKHLPAFGESCNVDDHNENWDWTYDENCNVDQDWDWTDDQSLAEPACETLARNEKDEEKKDDDEEEEEEEWIEDENGCHGEGDWSEWSE